MDLYQVGWHWKHPADFCIKRPNGLHGMQLIVINTKAQVSVSGTEFAVQPNTAFLIENCVPHTLRAAGEEYSDDWIRFTPEQEDRVFLDGLSLAWHVPVVLPDDTVSQMIAICDKIAKSASAEKQQILHHMLLSILLYLNGLSQPRTAARRNYYDRNLESLRKRIYGNPAEDWSIPQIAEELCISVSHFQRLYKQHFGISCTNDIFMSRMEYAKKLLLETELSAAEIAEQCGFRSYEHFSKSFAKYACMPPSRFRAKNREG
ncbi:MAG: helix-turn-helix transcriptional regulator [Oscillospiraceae bacterium]|nr:helix-turn-helix transcriptional regulator [Oscillospiraceae bacterium]